MKCTKTFIAFSILVGSTQITYGVDEKNNQLRGAQAKLDDQQSNILPFYKSTNHFIMYCEPVDYQTADIVLAKSEKDYAEISQLFEHSLAQPIIIKMFPDLKSFHTAINEPNAPDWVIGRTENNNDSGVSPRNPGPVHTFNSVMAQYKTSLIVSMIYAKYPHVEHIPRWLHQGVALHKTHYPSSKGFEELKILAQNPEQLTTFSVFESIEKKDNATFDKLNGFLIAPSLVQFIEQKWGWKVILALLGDYASFEKIMGISKTEFYNQWKQSLKK